VVGFVSFCLLETLVKSAQVNSLAIHRTSNYKSPCGSMMTTYY
jgi:hypothetical protein